MAHVTLTDANFQEEVGKSDSPVLVDFWAPWCGPCQMMEPVIQDIATQYEGKLKVGKLNVDENQKTASSYGIMSIPTLVFFRSGEKKEQLIGFRDKEALQLAIDAFLKS